MSEDSTAGHHGGRAPRNIVPTRPSTHGNGAEHESASTIYSPTMKTIIDWRLEICHFLRLDPTATDKEVFNELQEASAKIEEAQKAKQKSTTHQGPLRCQILHRVFCFAGAASSGIAMYMKEPWTVHAGPSRSHLTGSQQVTNMQLYLERNKDVIFLVHRDYICCRERYPPINRPRPGKELETMMAREFIEIVSPDLRSKLASLSDVVFQEIPHPRFSHVDEDEDASSYSYDEEHEEFRHTGYKGRDVLDMSYPYLWFYHRRSNISEAVGKLEEIDREHLNVFCGYIRTRMSDEWATVDKLISKGEITAKFVVYVYIPGDIVIWTPYDNAATKLQAYLVTDWLRLGTGWLKSNKSSASVPTTSWSFDGNFQRNESLLSLGDLPSLSHAFKIRNLNPHPKDFSDEGLGITGRLRERGEMFWRCRGRNYVCYKSFVDDGIKTATDSRFMIDVKILQQMHPEEHEQTNRDDLGTEQLSQAKPPLGDEFTMCLPPTIIGFNMQTKEWVTLDIDLIEDVTWNTDAFRLLVIDQRMKELVQAVVTNQIRAAESTDLIRGKGSGLTMLLHGGPGTGKTLTAESVAEVARKPLYRVTCGEIGTKAEEVEKYLETIFLLGKTWDCVVLLDEADVFLEQRSLVNLERNALVSVFLRMLEYYDGILILTSNRVGIFDEAFKSRIQLNLRYQNLDRDQRLEIWRNFISRLESLAGNSGDLEIDANEILGHIDDLAKPELNGREIRNAISTARQLARYREQALGFTHLQSVIAEAERFDQYLKDLHEGFTEDERQNDKGER